MSGSWSDVAALVVRLVSHEPPFVQIMCVAGVAFSFVIFLDGLRVNFLPARRHLADRPRRSPTRLEDGAEFPASVAVMASDAHHDVGSDNPQPAGPQASAPKSHISARMRSQQTPRPKSRRSRDPFA